MKKFRELLKSQESWRRTSITSVVILAIELLIGLAIVPAAHAAPCRTITDQAGANHTVCIVEIKRSAKYPWEYRVVLSQDGVKQPQELYHCRDTEQLPAEVPPVQLGSEGVPFRSGDTKEWICRLVKRK